MSSGGAALQPTFTGHVASTQDALILFEACLQGHLSHVPRRPHDRERNSLIRSGCVFIYEENASGIKRWTDGVTWSPSRILGNFLVYRELDKPFPPGEKKRAMKKNNRRPSRPGEPYARPDTTSEAYSPTTPQATNFGADKAASEIERQLIGSLIDSYGFKQDGLVKKTMSVTVQGVTHHLVSYYNVNDVVNNQLRTPSQTDALQYIRPRAELVTKQSFRSPIEELDELEGARAVGHSPYGYRLGPQAYPTQPYYMPQPYPPMPQQPTSAAYSVGIPAMTQGYVPGPGPQPPNQPQRNNEYHHYEQAPYNRSFDSLNNNLPPSTMSKPMPPTPTATMPPILNDRAQQQTLMYPHMQQRPMAEPAPSPIDTRNVNSYVRGSYSMGNTQSPIESQRSQLSPMSLKYEDNFNPSESRPALPQSQSMHPNHYSHSPSMPSWPGAAQPHYQQ